MLIAVTSNGTGANAIVPEKYEQSSHLLIIETDNDSIVAVYQSRDEEGLFFAKQSYLHDCEALVCGRMQKAGFEAVAAKSITRYYGAGLMPFDATHAAEENLLPLITDHEGGNGCGSHEADQCEEHLKAME